MLLTNKNIRRSFHMTKHVLVSIRTGDELPVLYTESKYFVGENEWVESKQLGVDFYLKDDTSKLVQKGIAFDQLKSEMKELRNHFQILSEQTHNEEAFKHFQHYAKVVDRMKALGGQSHE